MSSLEYQPSYIRYLEFTEAEFKAKLSKMKGIISSHMSIVSEKRLEDRFIANTFGHSMEKVIFEKIRTNEVSKRIFLDWFNSHEAEINQVLLTKNLSGLDFFSIAILMRNVSNENLSI